MRATFIVLLMVALKSLEASVAWGDSGSEYLIPNIVHHTYDYHRPSHFLYMSILCAQHFQKPDRHILWVNGEGHHREYWESWLSEASKRKAQPWEREFAQLINNGTVEAKLVVYPVHPPGMNSTYVVDKTHRSDFQRFDVLREMGGIYVDGDAFLTKSVDELRRFRFVVSGDNVVAQNLKASNARRLNSGILLSEPRAAFFNAWEKHYEYDMAKLTWDHHASVTPWNLMYEYPDLIHVELSRIAPISYGLGTSEAAAALTCGLLLPSKKAIWYPTATHGQNHEFLDKPDEYLYKVLETKLAVHLTMSAVPKLCMLRKWLGGPQDFSFMPSWLGRVFRLSTYRGDDSYDYTVNEALYDKGDTKKALQLWNDCRGNLGMNTPVARSSWQAPYERQQMVARHLP